MNIEDNFFVWLDKILKQNNFEDAVAFNFNLYQAKESLDIEFISTGSFDPDNPDWACDEVFTSRDNLLRLPYSIVTNDWKKNLELCTNLVKQYLEKGRNSSILKAKKAVGLGFVDGDLTIAYQS